MPLVGGELARAALEHGREAYGVAQLLRYEELTRGNETYLWYFPDGRPSSIETSTSPDASPTDGWGSTAMLFALVEGLGGVVDASSLYRDVRLSPRWAAAGCDRLPFRFLTPPPEPASRTGTRTMQRRRRSDSRYGPAVVDLHLLLPRGPAPARSG